jgi:peptidyl-prolyl cis-trans isomerase SurA
MMKPNELQDDATVRQKLSAIRDRILNHGEDFAGLAKVSSEDATSASDGGDLDWFNPGTYPDVEPAIRTLKDNEITEPFRTRDGWHIVQMLGRRQFDNTDELKRRHAAEAIRESRLDEATELWMRRLRDEAYVEYKL